jgi:hypothetical protein
MSFLLLKSSIKVNIMYLSNNDIKLFLSEIENRYSVYFDLNIAYFNLNTNILTGGEKNIIKETKKILNHKILKNKTIEFEFYLRKKDRGLAINITLEKTGFFICVSNLMIDRYRNCLIFSDTTSNKKTQKFRFLQIQSINEAIDKGFSKFEEGLSILGIKEHLIKDKILNF